MKYFVIVVVLFGLGFVHNSVASLPGDAKFYKVADKSDSKPEKGMSMKNVLRKFGEPIEKKPSAGKPPITRWIYEDFTVYFENDYVIHAVTNRKRLPR